MEYNFQIFNLMNDQVSSERISLLDIFFNFSEQQRSNDLKGTISFKHFFKSVYRFFWTMKLICETLSGNRSDENYRRQFCIFVYRAEARYSRHEMDVFMLT